MMGMESHLQEPDDEWVVNNPDWPKGEGEHLIRRSDLESRLQAPRTDGWDSDRIPSIMAQEQRDIREAVIRCRNIDDERTIYKGNINRLVGEREVLWEHLRDLHHWATNYEHSDPEVRAMLEEIREVLG